MNKLVLCVVSTLFICSALLLSCTKSEDTGTEKRAIDRMTDNAAKEMAESITVPLEKARNAKELVEEKYRDMEENIKKE